MKIKDMERQVGVTKANIRFYEKEGLLSPARGENNYREYTEEDREVLEKIRYLRMLGVTVSDIRQFQQGKRSLAAAPMEPTSHKSAASASFMGAPVANMMVSILNPAFSSSLFFLIYSVGRLVINGIIATRSTGRSPDASALASFPPAVLLWLLPALPQAVSASARPRAIVERNTFFHCLISIPPGISRASYFGSL